MAKRLLMIAYYFPPSLEVGRVRTVKFCKFLPEFGWRPVVVTCREPPGYDASLLGEVPPGTEVHRAGRGSLMSDVLQAGRTVRNCLRRLRPRRATAAEGGGPAAEAATSRLRRLLYWPDLEASWIGPAARKATALAAGCDALYSSGWPMSCHVAAFRVARRTGLPWIMDMRDPWNRNMDYPLGFQRRHFVKAERACVAAAARVINVNDHLTDRHRKENPDQSAEKFVTIRNGVDPDDFLGLPAAPPAPPLCFAYAGNFYGGRTPVPLMQAVRNLLDAGKVARTELRFTFMGSGADQYAEAAEQLGVADMVRLLPRQPLRNALEALSSSHVALVIGGPLLDRTTAAKDHELAFLGKPVLGLMPHVPMRESLEAGGAVCVDWNDVAAIGGAIAEIASRFRETGELPPPIWTPEAAGAHRRAQARQLADALSAVLAEAGRR